MPRRPAATPHARAVRAADSGPAAPPRTARTPTAAAMVESIVGCKWSVHLLGELARGPRRPSALLRACAGLSAKVMNERLRKFERFALTVRTIRGERPPVEVTYALTPLGERFVDLLAEVERLQHAIDADARDP